MGSVSLIITFLQGTTRARGQDENCINDAQERPGPFGQDRSRLSDGHATPPGRSGEPVPTVKGQIRPRRTRRQPVRPAASPLNPIMIVGFWACPQVYETSGLDHIINRRHPLEDSPRGA
jgi:hypothetical protein